MGKWNTIENQRMIYWPTLAVFSVKCH